MLVEYCKVEPEGQLLLGALITPPEAVPPKVVQTLFVTCTTGAATVKSGQVGHVPGTVVTVLVGLDLLASALQLQRVNIVCPEPVWAYVGKVVLQFPPLLVEYCNVEPAGQLPLGALITPPEAVPPNVVQTLLVTCTTGAADVKSGQVGHVPGTVVMVLVGLDLLTSAVQLQRVKIVCPEPVCA